MRGRGGGARTVRTANVLLAWVRSDPEHASFVVPDADGDEALAFGPDRRWPGAALPVLWRVAEWAEAEALLGGARLSPDALASRRLLDEDAEGARAAGGRDACAPE